MTRDELIQGLARVIDPDEPFGLAATALARRVIALVENRGAKSAFLLAEQLEALNYRCLR